MRFRILAALVAITSILSGVMPVFASHNEDIHSDNIKSLVRQPIEIDKDLFAQGSDLAFQGNLMYAGSYQGTALYKIVGKREGYLKQIGFHQCPGSQGDVSIVGTTAFVSIDSASSNSVENGSCNNTKATGFVEADKSTGLEGVRVVDYSNPEQPKQVAFVTTKCGSHTHTLVPDGDTTYMYIESYPLTPTADCEAATGHGQVSILKFPTNDPSKLEFVDYFDITPTPLPNDAPIGCHDLQAWPEKDIVIAACITESQVWDIKDPAKPVILARITNPDISIHHSAAFTWDGKYAIISDEYAGAEGGGCVGDQTSTVGAMWFYDLADPASPALKGHYSLPRVPPADSDDEASRFRCTTHLYTILPMKDPAKYIAVSSYYSGGISAVDFSDPANPVELGFYLQQPGGVNPDSWSAYWYNGRIYTNDHASLLGVTVFKMKGTGKKKVRFYDGGLNPQTQIAKFK
jgi:hypothetical protein